MAVIAEAGNARDVRARLFLKIEFRFVDPVPGSTWVNRELSREKDSK